MKCYNDCIELDSKKNKIVQIDSNYMEGNTPVILDYFKSRKFSVEEEDSFNNVFYMKFL